MEIQNKEYKLMSKFKTHIEKNKGYFLKPKYDNNSKWLHIHKRRKLFRFFIDFNWVSPITQNVFFYDDWIHIEVIPKFKDDIVELVKGFNHKVKIKVWGELGNE